MELMTHSSAFHLPHPPPTDNDPSLTYALVVLNRRVPRFTPLLWKHAQLRLCADGGANRLYDELPLLFPDEDASAIRQRYKPDAIKGDMDSIREDVLQFYKDMAYAVIAKGFRLVCTNTTGKNVRSVVLKTQGSGSLKDNIITVFGLNTFSCLEPVRLNISNSCEVEGFVSKSGNGSGRNIGDRQFFYVNGRPVDTPKVGKLVNELYRGANSKQYPIVIMNFSVATQAYDVNVTPDKRKIFFSDESSILQSLRDALEKIYSSNQASYSVNRVEELNEERLGSNLHSPRERSQMPSKQLFPDICIIREESDDKMCADDGTVVTPAQRNIRESSDVEITQSGGASSMIEDFAIKVRDHQKKNFVGPNKQLTDFAFARIDKHAPVESTSAQKGCGDSHGHSSIIQMSLNKFVNVNKRKHESVETALSEAPLLRSGPTICRLEENSSLKHTEHKKSADSCA